MASRALRRRIQRQALPQFALEELAAGVAGQGLGEEPDVAWDLVAGGDGSEMVAQVRGGQTLTGARIDHQGDLLAQPLVWHPEDAALGHRVVTMDGRLDLGAIDV